MNITKKEIIALIVWSIFIIILSIIPYLIGASYCPPGMKFMYFIGNNFDQNSYIAWMKQAQEGNILFEDKFTTEPHPKVFFHPFFLFCGIFSSITGIDLLITYHLIRVIFTFILLILVYLFSSIFLSKIHYKLFFLMLISLSSGLGWLAPHPLLSPLGNNYQIMSIDMWVSEAITFLIILTKPLFITALILMISIFILILKSYETKKVYLSVIAGILGAILGLIHPYDIITIYSVNIIYLIWIRGNYKQIKSFIIFLILSLPAIIYEYIIFTFTPVFKEWAKTFTLSPNPYSFIIGYGFIGLFAFIYIYYNWDKKSKKDIFLISWVFTVLLLSYFPIRFQRRLILGLHIPLTLLATNGIFKYVIPWIKNKPFFKKINEAILLLIIFVLTIPTNIRYIIDDLYHTKTYYLNYNLYNEDVEALKWVDKNIPSSETVLASFVIGIYIPGWTGNKVYVGHYDQTINANEKLKRIRIFFNNETTINERINLIKESKARYIYYGPFERIVGTPNFDKMDFLKKIYQNEKVSIYKINDDVLKMY
jgi:hypothetical protein